MLKNKKILFIIIAIISVLLIGGIGVILLGSRAKEISLVTDKTITVFDTEGVPPTDSVLYTEGGWNKVPALHSLNLLASELNGGQLGLISLYTDTNTGTIYIEAQIIGDYDTLNKYFIYTVASGWTLVRPEQMSNDIRLSLDKKLQTPLSQQDQLGEGE